MYGERVLIGWIAIEAYVDETWHVPPTTLREYRPSLVHGHYVLRRTFGRFPDRSRRVFTLPSLLDDWMRVTFSIPSGPPKPLPKHSNGVVKSLAKCQRRVR
jgi:hypothetical protein